MNRFYRFIHRVFAPLIRRIFRVSLSGAENIPENGAILVCANHLSNHDVLILAACFKRQISFLAKKELFRIPILKQLITSLGAYPVDRSSADVGAIKNTIRLLSEGNAVGFYPQGTRKIGIDPRTTEPKHGIGLIESRTQVPILPVAIQTKGYKIKFFKKVYVNIGRVISPEKLSVSNTTVPEYTRVSKLVFGEILNLMKDDETL